MKPLSLRSSNQAPFRRHVDRTRHNVRDFPRMDYHYQATASAVATSLQSRAKVRLSDLRDFRKISSEFMAAETHRDYAAEAALFALVTGLAAWPIISMLILLAQTAPG